MPGLERPRAPSRASIARQALSVLAVAREVGDLGGCLAGAGEGVDGLAEQHGRGEGRGQVPGGAGEDPGGRGDRAGEGAHGAGDVAGDADPQRRGGDPAAAGAGEGLGGRDCPGGALGLAGQCLAHAEPAGRDLGGDGDGGALAGGGVAQRAGEAAGGGGLVVAGVAGAGDRPGPGLAAEDLAGGPVGVAADGLLVLALVGCVGREGGRRRGEVGGDRLGDLLDGPGEGFGELGGDGDDQGGGRGGVGVDAEDAAPAAGEGGPGAQVAVGGGWNSRQVARRRARLSVPMAASTLAVTGAVSSGSRMPASSRASRRAAAAPASRGLAGSAPAAVKSARMSLVAQARSQRRSPGRRPAWRASMRDSSSWRAAVHQFARRSPGRRTRVWAAWAHSSIRAPQVTG